MTTSKILIVSESDDAHVSVIMERLSVRSIESVWLKTDLLMERNCSWSIPTNSVVSNRCDWYDDEIKTVWYRKRHRLPSLHVDAITSFVQQESEGLLSSILLQYQNCRWVSSLAALAAARPKIHQLQVAKQRGFQIPDTLVTNDVQHLRAFHKQHGGQVIVKPIQTQVVEAEEDNLVLGTRHLPLHALEDAVTLVPCYAQECLVIAAEVRIIVFGDRAYAFLMVPQVAVEDLKQLELGQIHHSIYTISKEMERQICELVASFGLQFAACDFALVHERGLVFLEVNPNGQWLWLQYATGFNLEDPFIDFLCR